MGLTVVLLEIDYVAKTLDVQYERGQVTAVAASDSSDKSKEKADQKVYDLTPFAWLQTCSNDDEILFKINISFCRLCVDLPKIVKLPEKVD